MLTLVDTVFNENHLRSTDFVEYDIDAERKNEKIKVTKLMSLYQIIYYILHAGKKETFLHMMTTHDIYEKCKSIIILEHFVTTSRFKKQKVI